MESKPIWQSRTVWVNVAIAILTIGLYVAQGLHSGALQLPWSVDPVWLVVAINIINVVLRSVTGQPVSWRAGSGRNA